MEITGKVENILPVEKGTTKKGDEWQKQIFTVRTNEEYDNLYAFDAFGKAMELMPKVKEGSEVTVAFNVRTNEYNGKYYTSLSPWKVDVVSESATPKETAKSREEAFAEEDSLPF